VTPEQREPGRLHARPREGARSEASPGLARLAQGLLYVPPGLDPARPAPLAVLLHGAGGEARGGLAPLLGLADEAGLVLLAPDARGATWDVISGGYGPDVAVIDALLGEVFERLAVDSAAVALGGFSDGASYALSLGLTNGDLFTHLLAFSPGFLAPAAQRGEPAIFVSHGTRDAVLPIERCSRRIVPALREAGFAVDYREFEGGHGVPPAIAAEAVAWLEPER
jgi:predicted esterase